MPLLCLPKPSLTTAYALQCYALALPHLAFAILPFAFAIPGLCLSGPIPITPLPMPTLPTPRRSDAVPLPSEALPSASLSLCQPGLSLSSSWPSPSRHCAEPHLPFPWLFFPELYPSKALLCQCRLRHACAIRSLAIALLSQSLPSLSSAFPLPSVTKPPHTPANALHDLGHSHLCFASAAYAMPWLAPPWPLLAALGPHVPGLILCAIPPTRPPALDRFDRFRAGLTVLVYRKFHHLVGTPTARAPLAQATHATEFPKQRFKHIRGDFGIRENV